jgi:hypothetical protein
MYCLIQLYMPIAWHLAKHRPLLKLFAVKAVGEETLSTLYEASKLESEYTIELYSVLDVLASHVVIHSSLVWTREGCALVQFILLKCPRLDAEISPDTVHDG